MAKKCGLVIYNRPCRTTPRYFKCCDVVRIAQQCVNDTNENPDALLAAVAKGLSYKRVLLDKVTDGDAFEWNGAEIVAAAFVDDGVIAKLSPVNRFLLGVARVVPVPVVKALALAIVGILLYIYRDASIDVDTVINAKCNCRRK